MTRSRASVLVRLFILKTGHLTIHFRKRNIYLGSQFQRVWSMLLPCMILDKRSWWKESDPQETFSLHGSQNSECQEETMNKMSLRTPPLHDLASARPSSRRFLTNFNNHLPTKSSVYEC